MNSFSVKITKKIGVVTAYVFTILQLIGYIFNSEITSYAILCSIPVILLRHVYLTRLSNVSLNFARYILWIGWDISMVVMPCLLYDSYSLSARALLDGTYLFFTTGDVDFCIGLGLFTLSLVFVSSVWWKNDFVPQYDYYPNFSKNTGIASVIAIIMIMFVALSLSKYFGTNVLGMQATLLPYKLTGIINLFGYGLTLFFYLYILDFFSKARINIGFAFLIILFFGLMAALTSYSKAALIMAVAIPIFYALFTNIITMRFLTIALVFLFAAFVIGGFLQTYRESLHGLSAYDISELTSDYGVTKYVNRIFSDGTTLMKFHASMGQDALRDLLKSYNYNFAYLNTYGIDRASIRAGSSYSAGCVTLAGAYVLGYHYYAAFVIFISLALSYVDYRLPRLKNIFSSTLMRIYLTFYLSRSFLTVLLLEFFSGMIGTGSFAFFIFPVLCFSCFVLYLTLFTSRKPI